MARTLKPINCYFEIVYDDDQAKLGGLPIFGFAARLHYWRDCYQPPGDGPDFKELAEHGRDAITAYISDLCELFTQGPPCRDGFSLFHKG